MDVIQLLDEAYILRKPLSQVSDLKGQIRTPMTNEQIDQQLEQIRNEWERDF